MPGSKEIRTKINSVKNTRKITKAMEMVAASKMRKAQERMRRSRPYAGKIRNVINHLAHAHPEYHHPYMMPREPKRVGVIVVSSDKGLCGGLNTNLFKTTLNQLKTWDKNQIGIDMCTIGNKGTMFFKRIGANIVAQTTHLGDKPTLEDLIGLVRVQLDAYDNGTVDQIHVIYNHFINSMTQKPTVQQLVPIQVEEEVSQLTHLWDYIYEPKAEEVLDGLLMRFIESLAYQAVVENIASEQAARMVAMKSASDNASGLIDELQLAYNKARQAAITKELSEIVGGAAAV